MGAVADSLPVPPVILGAAVILALAFWGWRQYYQFCPHCGALARRVYAGWRRCRRCGRQYRRGLRLR
jgi:NADH pyrophosphatase NudC (nudix superfamily)